MILLRAGVWEVSQLCLQSPTSNHNVWQVHGASCFHLKPQPPSASLDAIQDLRVFTKEPKETMELNLKASFIPRGAQVPLSGSIKRLEVEKCLLEQHIRPCIKPAPQHPKGIEVSEGSLHAMKCSKYWSINIGCYSLSSTFSKGGKETFNCQGRVHSSPIEQNDPIIPQIRRPSDALEAKTGKTKDMSLSLPYHFEFGG